jgi:hypothetical protein
MRLPTHRPECADDNHRADQHESCGVILQGLHPDRSIEAMPESLARGRRCGIERSARNRSRLKSGRH